MSDMREDFEEAAMRLGYNLTMAEHETGEYHYPATQDAWDMWQDAVDSVRAQGGEGAEPVAEIVHDYNGISVQWLEPAKYGRFQSGQKLYTQPQPAVPEDEYEHLHKTIELLTKKLVRAESAVPDTEAVRLARKWLSMTETEGGHLHYDDVTKMAEALLSTPTTPQADGCTCQKCHAVYDGDLMVPNDIWEKIKPDGKPAGSGLLCPNCMVSTIVNRGIWTALVGQDIDLTNAKNTGWISCVKRLPAEKDADCEGCVWHSDGHLVHTAYFGHVKADPDHYWMPTGLKRPQPPKEGE